MNKLRWIVAILGGLILVGCPQPNPGPGVNPPGLVDCAIPAVRDHGIALIPQVNDCLTGQGGWMGCLSGLIAPAVGITEDVLHCVVQSSGKSFGAAASANPADSISGIGASRAQEYIQSKGLKFK